MALHRRSPRALARALAPLQDAVAPRTLMAEIQAAWPAAVGELIVREATPVSERNGTLTVRCSEAGWAHELDLMSEDVRSRLNPHLTMGVISALRCVTDARP